MGKKIFAGPAHNNVPETREVSGADAVGTPGVVVGGDGVPFSGNNELCVVATVLHGSVDDKHASGTSRIYLCKSGDLFNVRAAAGQVIKVGVALKVNANGRVEVSTDGTDTVYFHAQETLSAASEVDQLVLVRVI